MALSTTQSVVSSAKTALTPDGKKPVAALLAVLGGYLALLALTWMGIDTFAERRAIADAQYRANNWAIKVTRKLVFVEQTYQSGKMQIYDKHVIKTIARDKEVYRYSLLKADGTVFWSSRRSLIGEKVSSSLLKAAVANAKQTSELFLVKDKGAEKSQKMSHSHDHSKMSLDHLDGVPFKGDQDVGMTVVPVFFQKTHTGFVVVHTNLTSTISWLKDTARDVAWIVSAILGVIFAAIGLMIWQFAKARAQQVVELQASELEAVEMADQLKVMNEDIIVLNADLNESMTTLRKTQDEVIRKGKMAQLGQLTATVAHDIRNPLGTVRTSTFLLRRKFVKDHPTMEKPLSRIEKGVERCDGIITELLDFTRSKSLNLKQKSVDNWLVELLQDQMQSIPDEVAIEVHCGLGDNEYKFDGDSLTRAVINFLSNASEAMVGKGSERPLNPTKNPRIVVSTKLSERGVEIAVKDNGPGISQGNIEKILDPLFTTKSFGVGLGLPAVEKIFEQHGGGLEVTSIEGEGATFTGWISPKLSNEEHTVTSEDEPKTQETKAA